MLSDSAIARILKDGEPCKYCGRKARLEDLANRHGVSEATISRVLRGKSERIEEVARRLKTPATPPPSGFVENRPLREAFESSRTTASLLAFRLGYERRTPSGGKAADIAPVRRALGLQASAAGQFQSRMQIRTALRYVEALGLDPVDFGL